jgi:hypothetical protein
MTDKESLVEARKISVRIAETKVRDAEMEFAEGFKELKARFDIEVNLLRSEVEREKLELQKQIVFLKEAETTLQNGFES